MRRNFLRTGLLALAAVLLIGCGDNNKVASSEVVFNRGNGAEPETLDPSLALAIYEDSIIGDLIMGLMTEDVNGRPIPGAATSWETSADGLTWTFHLRDENWSDGVPVTAEDFVFGWQRVVDPKSASKYAYFLGLVKNATAISAGKMPPSVLGVRAKDAKTFEVTLTHPVPYMLELVMHTTTYPLPKHVVEKFGKDWVKPGNYVGNGAYTLVDWVPNDHITVKKNPRFYDAANVKVDKVIFYPTADYDAGLRRFRAGELDMQTRMPANQINLVRSTMPEVMDPVPELTLELYCVNFKRPAFQDVRVREALNLAVDRDTITGKIRRLGEPPAYNYVPPSIANYPHSNTFDFTAMPYAARVAKAQGLMQAAGYGPAKRLKTTLMIRGTSNDIERQVAAAVQQMWKAIYIDIEIVPTDTAIFYSKIQEHDFDIAKPGWGADFDDASNFLDLLRTGVGNNWGAYSNPVFDRLMDQAQTETDLTKRGQLLSQAEALAMKDQAWMPLLYWVTMSIKWPYVTGWKNDAMDKHRSRWVSIDTKARAAKFGH